MESMKLFTNVIMESSKEMFIKWQRLLLSILLDSAMIFAAYLFGELFFRWILIRFDIISEILKNNPEILTTSLNSGFVDKYAPLASNLKEIIFLLLAYFLMLYIVYVIFQGLNWFMVIKSEYKKVTYFNFIKKFKIVTFAYLVGFIVLTGVTFYISAKTLFAIETELSRVFQTVSYLLIFFLMVSTGYVTKFKAGKSLVKTFKFDFNFLLVFLSVVFFGLMIVVADLILMAVWYIHPLITFVLGSIFIVLILSYMRIHLTKIVKKMK